MSDSRVKRGPRRLLAQGDRATAVVGCLCTAHQHNSAADTYDLTASARWAHGRDLALCSASGAPTSWAEVALGLESHGKARPEHGHFRARSPGRWED